MPECDRQGGTVAAEIVTQRTSGDVLAPTEKAEDVPRLIGLRKTDSLCPDDERHDFVAATKVALEHLCAAAASRPHQLAPFGGRR